MLRCCKLPAACLSTEPQTREGPPSFRGRTALGADCSAKGHAYKARHSGRTGPTYCNKPNWAPPVIGGLVRTVARGDSRCKAENVFLIGRFPLMARNGHWRRMRCRPYVSARPNPAKAFAGPKRPVARKGINTMRLRTRSQTCPLVRGRQVCSVYSCRRLGQTRPTAICTEDFPVDWEGRDEGEAV